MKGSIALSCLLFLIVPVTAFAEAPAGAPAEFRLGFKALAGQIPGLVGTPVEEEHHGLNGDGLQQTSTGLMVWRKADNWTAFTNGSRTWINGPQGVAERSNDDRFPWEADDRLPRTQQAEASLFAEPAPRPQPPAQDASEFEAATEDAALDWINQGRARYGAPPVVMDEATRRVARVHAKDMALRNFFAHDNPDGKSPFDRLKAAGIRYGWAAENLGWASGYRTALEAVRRNHDAMMAETPPNDGHLKNIVNPKLRKAGIGVYRTPDGRTYYVSDFTD